MNVCRHCGQDIHTEVDRGKLRVDLDGSVYWEGVKKLRLQPQQRKIMVTLAIRGTATHLALQMLSESHEGQSITVQVSNLRKKLREAGVPVTIKSVAAVGYKLEISDGQSS